MRKESLSRVKLIFDLFDTDGTGSLQARDFELMATRVVLAATESDTTAKAAMISAFRHYWATLALELDANRDGHITFEEYAACVLSPERFDAAVTDFAEALAVLGDPDCDGLIDRHVFMSLMLAIGFEKENIDALFDAFEPSEMDQISVSVWSAGIKDYYSASKAGIPGDLLVGDFNWSP